ncbi:hypothetical protein C8R44DRAFT_886506 [Mycena epipterygia]|nr:hypothetical protein C8R44DRAFT_886506 [Mycena epipterygia]
MSAEDWDNTPATTNTGEAQHHWTNLNTGVKLSVVEAIESGRKLDERVSAVGKGSTTKSNALRTVFVSANSSGRVKTKIIGTDPAPPHATDTGMFTESLVQPMASTSAAPHATNTGMFMEFSMQPIALTSAAVPSMMDYSPTPPFDYPYGAADVFPFSYAAPTFNDTTANLTDFGFDFLFLEQFNAPTPQFDHLPLTTPTFDSEFAALFVPDAPASPLAASSEPWPCLPPLPPSSSPPKLPTIASPEIPIHKVSKKRTRDEVDPLNVLNTSRMRKKPKRPDA